MSVLTPPNWDLIQPVARGAFMRLRDRLATGFASQETRTNFQPFELYRSPERQAVVFRAGHSKARPWQSAHQYGLAVDFVPRELGRWSWEGTHDWPYLRAQAQACGLVAEIAWDKPHVEHPLFRELRELLAPSQPSLVTP